MHGRPVHLPDGATTASDPRDPHATRLDPVGALLSVAVRTTTPIDSEEG